jgi:1,2-diacylglycerol 3-alpha-glucosyltransferase
VKILHCCLAVFYIDNYNYQENIISRLHKKMGHEVKILASCETYIDNIELGYTEPKKYFNEDMIEVTRLPYISLIPLSIAKKIRVYHGIKKYLESYSPDIIFIHDCQFLSIDSIARYVSINKTKIYVDCHTDFINSARGWMSKNILHKLIYRFCFKRIDKYVSKYYGTLPARVKFLELVYGVDKEKISLLPFGFDDTVFTQSQKYIIRNEKRNELGYHASDIVVVSGGKIDQRKNIHLLMQFFSKINKNESYKSLKLLLFGKLTDEMAYEVSQYFDCSNIKYINWLPASEIYKYFLASDLAVFPGTHSVLWEEAVGLGLPCIFHAWQDMHHVDLGGNCILIENITVESLEKTLISLIENPDKLNSMRENAEFKGPLTFSYSKIAATAITT